MGTRGRSGDISGSRKKWCASDVDDPYGWDDDERGKGKETKTVEPHFY